MLWFPIVERPSVAPVPIAAPVRKPDVLQGVWSAETAGVDVIDTRPLIITSWATGDAQVDVLVAQAAVRAVALYQQFAQVPPPAPRTGAAVLNPQVVHRQDCGDVVPHLACGRAEHLVGVAGCEGRSADPAILHPD